MEFMLAFRFQPVADFQPTEAEMAEMHQSWGAFIGEIALQEKLVSTHRLGMEGCQVFADQSVEEGIAVHEGLTLSGNMIVRAASLAEATEMARKCPILFMGGSVEVRSILPM